MESEKVFNAFVSEARRLKALAELNAVELDYSARHLAAVLGMKGVKVLFAENIQAGRTGDDHRTVGVFKVKEMGYHNLIKIDKRQPKMEMIDTFVHEMYHRYQHFDITAFQKAMTDDDFEKVTYAFTKKVMKEVGE